MFVLRMEADEDGGWRVELPEIPDSKGRVPNLEIGVLHARATLARVLGDAADGAVFHKDVALPVYAAFAIECFLEAQASGAPNADELARVAVDVLCRRMRLDVADAAELTGLSMEDVVVAMVRHELRMRLGVLPPARQAA
jgi:hypothetical protein